MLTDEDKNEVRNWVILGFSGRQIAWAYKVDYDEIKPFVEKYSKRAGVRVDAASAVPQLHAAA